MSSAREILSSMDSKTRGLIVASLFVEDRIFFGLRKARLSKVPFEFHNLDISESVRVVAHDPLLNQLALQEGVDTYIQHLDIANLDEETKSEKIGEFMSLPIEPEAREVKIRSLYETWFKKKENKDIDIEESEESKIQHLVKNLPPGTEIDIA